MIHPVKRNEKPTKTLKRKRSAYVIAGLLVMPMNVILSLAMNYPVIYSFYVSLPFSVPMIAMPLFISYRKRSDAYGRFTLSQAMMITALAMLVVDTVLITITRYAILPMIAVAEAFICVNASWLMSAKFT